MPRIETRFACAIAFGSLMLGFSPLAAAEDAEKASATLPLEEILKLYRDRDEASREEKPEPPLAASLQQVQLTGRVLNEGIDFKAHFEVIVLGQDQWVSVPLLAHDERIHVSKLPKVSGGAFAVSDGQLVFLMSKPGRYAFDISFYRAATQNGKTRNVSVTHGGAALATCRLEIDAGLFQLKKGSRTVEARDGVLVLPSGDAFEIAWQAREGAAEVQTVDRTLVPAMESVASRVHASIVSTLEGRRINRLLYELRFSGRKTIEIELPEGHLLERAFLNGVAVPLKANGRHLTLDVAPARAGEIGGSLEIVVSHAGGIFNLAGALRFELPRVSWPTHELYLSLHLPRVFDYEWAGGSLEPASGNPRVKFSYEVPLPGKPLHFRQVLISRTAPDLDLDYEVDLDGHTFHAGRPRPEPPPET